MSIKRLFFALILTFCLAFAVACGDDDGDTDDGNNSNSQSSCTSTHECVNGVCECTTEGKQGDPCTDSDACVDECEVCS